MKTYAHTCIQKHYNIPEVDNVLKEVQRISESDPQLVESMHFSLHPIAPHLCHIVCPQLVRYCGAAEENGVLLTLWCMGIASELLFLTKDPKETSEIA